MPTARARLRCSASICTQRCSAAARPQDNQAVRCRMCAPPDQPPKTAPGRAQLKRRAQRRPSRPSSSAAHRARPRWARSTIAQPSGAAGRADDAHGRRSSVAGRRRAKRRVRAPCPSLLFSPFRSATGPPRRPLKRLGERRSSPASRSAAEQGPALAVRPLRLEAAQPSDESKHQRCAPFPSPAAWCLRSAARAHAWTSGSSAASVTAWRNVHSPRRTLCREYTAPLAISQAACRNSVSAPLRRVPNGGLLARAATARCQHGSAARRSACGCGCARDYGVGAQAPRQACHVRVEQVDVQVLKLSHVAGGNLQRVVVHVHAHLQHGAAS